MADRLIEAQSARFTRLDPLLPAAARPPEGEVVTAALADGARVAGVFVHSTFELGTASSLWSALSVWELHPLIGDGGGEAMEALLRGWRGLMDRTEPGPDSACVVTWPSRDVESTKALLDHGFLPLSCVGVRLAGQPTGIEVPGAGDTTIRPVRPADLDSALDLALDELEYSSLVGATVWRPGAAELKRDTLARRLEQGDPMWLAERDGVAVGLVECWLTDAKPDSWTATRLPLGRWGYVNCLSVAPEARGSGVGRDLMAVAHRELAARGAIGTFLYFNPPNPLSTVFWARQSYRPLWTIWEVRPAGAFR